MTRIVGHFWNEELYGGDGNDQIYAKGGDDYAAGGWGNDRVFGDAGNDWLTGDEGRDRVGGGIGYDSVWDRQGDYNILDGGAGDDWVGGVGDLYGHAGNDTLYTDHGGELQGTTMTGGTGVDMFEVTMDGNSGAVWDDYAGLVGLGAHQDIVIKDFHPHQDHLELNAVDPFGNWVYGNQQMVATFDSNLDGALTKDDTYVDATADGRGIELHFWNVDLQIDNIQALTQDFLL